MNTVITTSIIAIVILTAIGWTVITRTPTITPVISPEPTPSASAIPSQFYSGDSRFSQGSCSEDSDCMTGGCSGEACINKTLTDKDGSITTCEFDENFPNIQGYTCGCKQNVCGWR